MKPGLSLEEEVCELVLPPCSCGGEIRPTPLPPIPVDGTAVAMVGQFACTRCGKVCGEE